MKAVILAGGLGTRLAEETHLKPKPMIEVGGKPLLWHLMKYFSSQGVQEFLICCGYRGYVIKEYFANYFLHTSDVTFRLATNEMTVHEKFAEPWEVTLVDTGELTQTGGRLKRVAKFLKNESCFCLTYGDGLADLDLKALIATHESSKHDVTLTAVRPPGRFGALELVNGEVRAFREKPEGDGGWINGGFFMVSHNALAEIEGDRTSWEQHVLPNLASQGRLGAHLHHGFWQPMDTLREKNHLEALWLSGSPPWLP
jgi:glucose-1-phosphate cytidylyltransferase